MRFELQTLNEYSDEEILKEVNRVAAAFGGGRLTQKQFNSLSRVHVTTVRKRFGSWNIALDKAGVSESLAPRLRGSLTRDDVIRALREVASENRNSGVKLQDVAKRLGIDRTTLSGKFGRWGELLAEAEAAPVPLGRRYTEEECFENILALWTHYGRQPNIGELKLVPSSVGPKAYVRRWGGWRAALAAFVKRANEQEEEPIELTAAGERLGEADALKQAPRSMPLSLRYRVLVRDKFRCLACGASPAKDGAVELHVDHIHPWSRGGQNIEQNLRTLCSRCNLGKGASLDKLCVS